MKKTILSALLFVSAVGQASQIEGIRSANAVSINSVQAVNVGEHGFPVTEVSVLATFSNRCQVPAANELVSIVNYSKSYENLNIALGSEKHRMCTMEYMPVTVTIKLGRFTKPNDGHFSSITVNNVEAE